MRAGWPRSYSMNALSDWKAVAAGAFQSAPSAATWPSVSIAGLATPCARVAGLPAIRFSDEPRPHDVASAHSADSAASVIGVSRGWKVRRTGGRMVLSRPPVGNVDE